RVRLDQHFADILKAFPLSVSDAVKIVDVSKVRQHTGNVSGDLRLLQTNIGEKAPPDQFSEELPQGSLATRTQRHGPHKWNLRKTFTKNFRGRLARGQSDV